MSFNSMQEDSLDPDRWLWDDFDDSEEEDEKERPSQTTLSKQIAKASTFPTSWHHHRPNWLEEH